MGYNLYWYQQECVDSIFEYFRHKKGNPVVCLPTGTGKSLIIAEFVRRAFAMYANQKMLVLTHSKTLVEQNAERLKQHWPQAPYGINSAALNRRDTLEPIIFGGIASVAKSWHKFGRVDVVLIDEAHLVSHTETTMYRKFLDNLKSVNPHLVVIGLTATPWRLGYGTITDNVKTAKGELKSLFTDICYDLTTPDNFNRLIAEGFLSPLTTKRTRYELDATGVHIVAGDYNQKELQLAVDKDTVTAAALDEAVVLAADRLHWLVFASGVEHAEHVAEALNRRGIAAGYLHSNMPQQEQDEAVRRFKSGELRALVNNNILTTGFDFPELDCIIVLRLTESVVLWRQMTGRGTRIAEGKRDCLVLDFARNTERLGAINHAYVPRKPGTKGGGRAPVKECPACGNYCHLSVKVCENLLPDGRRCGHLFNFEFKVKTTASTESIIEGALPKLEIRKLDLITYAVHHKAGSPDMLKATYYCGLSKFDEYVHLEHPGYAGKRAREWWRLRDGSGGPVPRSTAEARERVEGLRSPTHLRIWINKKYPEILGYCWDGSAFGTAKPVTAGAKV